MRWEGKQNLLCGSTGVQGRWEGANWERTWERKGWKHATTKQCSEGEGKMIVVVVLTVTCWCLFMRPFCFHNYPFFPSLTHSLIHSFSLTLHISKTILLSLSCIVGDSLRFRFRFSFSFCIKRIDLSLKLFLALIHSLSVISLCS